MTIADISSLKQYTASAGQTIFPFPFRIFANEDIKVYQTAEGQPFNPSADILILDIDYTVTFNFDADGGEVILIVPAILNDSLTIQRDLSVARPTDYGNTGKFTGNSIDNQLDKITGIQKDIKSLLQERGLLYKINEEIGPGQTTLPKLPPGYSWKADASGNLVAVECIDEEGCSTLRAELLSETQIAPGTNHIGMYDVHESSGKKVTEFLNNLAPQKDSRPIIKNAADETKEILMDASNISSDTQRTIIMPDSDVDLSLITVKTYDPEHLHGLKTENASEDLAHDIRIAKGGCIDSTNSVDIDLLTSLRKRIDSPWAFGDGNGGLADPLILSNNTTYHFGVIKAATFIDAGWDTDINFANLLLHSGATHYRRIASFYTDDGENLRPYYQINDYFYLKYINDIEHNITIPDALSHDLILLIPRDLSLIGIINVILANANQGVRFFHPNFSDDAIVNARMSIHTSQSDGSVAQGYMPVPTNNLATIKYRAEHSGKSFHAATVGWIDFRGKT